mmetsp:Transcript_2395/g.6978  ORF Transcript_2395/g.6978 Transcript_2395/m.6978 type:complete len:134 (-) Transcript_2395:8-409(-)
MGWGARATGGRRFIEKDAPWCGHCKRLQREWTEASKSMSELYSDVALAKVDLTRNENVGLQRQFAIRGYPSIKIFKDGDPLPYEYHGPHQNSSGIVHNLVEVREKLVRRERERDGGHQDQDQDFRESEGEAEG